MAGKFAKVTFDEQRVSRRINRGVRLLKEGEQRALRGGAAAAKAAAVEKLGPSKRARVAQRSDRPAAGLAGLIDYEVQQGRPGNISRVTLNKKNLSQVPYWRVQEIGTGENAKEWNLDSQGKAFARSIQISSQSGRVLPSRLQFTNGGRFFPPSSTRNDDNLAEVPRGQRVIGSDGKRMRRASAIRLKNEVPGQHYIREGTRSGRIVFRRTLSTAFRGAAKAFKATPKFPKNQR